MEAIDFIFTFEHKARELGSLCLIADEMERRGYSTKIINIHDVVQMGKRTYEARVGVIPAAYDNKSLYYSFSTSIVPRKVVNLQWEQVFSVHQERDLQSRRNITGISKSAVHLSWGENNRDRLINVCDIDPRKVKITGHVGMDFLRKELLPYYIEQDTLFKEYNIDSSKKVCLFLSSFTSTGALKHEVDKNARTLGKQVYDRRILSIDTQKIVLEWIKRILIEDENLIFIYRPHPAERDNDAIVQMTKQLDNFFVIRDHSAKQWMITSDQIFTWSSTSIVESFFAKKNCQILRPIEIPNDLDMMIYQGADFLETYEQFKDSITRDSAPFPIDEEIIVEYYYYNSEVPTYILIADVLEEVYEDPFYDLTDEEIREIPYGLSEGKHDRGKIAIRNMAKRSRLSNIYYKFMLGDTFGKYLPKSILKKKELYRIYEEDNKRKNASPEEIKSVKKKISDLNLASLF